MTGPILRFALPLSLGFLALIFPGPIRAFQQGGSGSHTPSSKPSGNDSRYTRITYGSGYTDGQPSALGGYIGPNGEKIGTVTADFGVISAAKAAHQHVYYSAAEIMKQEDILDENGKVIGYRSVLSLFDKDHKKVTHVVVTKGSYFREIISYSAQDALAFEDATQPDKP